MTRAVTMMLVACLIVIGYALAGSAAAERVASTDCSTVGRVPVYTCATAADIRRDKWSGNLPQRWVCSSSPTRCYQREFRRSTEYMRGRRADDQLAPSRRTLLDGTGARGGRRAKFPLSHVNDPSRPNGHWQPQGKRSDRRTPEESPALSRIGGPPRWFLGAPPAAPGAKPVVLGVGGRPHIEIVAYRSVDGPCLYVDEVGAPTFFGSSCNSGFGPPPDAAIMLTGAGAGYVSRSERRYSEIDGILSPRVASVRVLYRHDGQDRGADAVIGWLKGDLLSRIGLGVRPFGVFAFAINRCITSDLTAIAFDRNGKVLGEAATGEGPVPMGGPCAPRGRS